MESHDPTSLAHQPLIGRKVFGNYVVDRKLGEGGMGAVYRVQDRLTGEMIALKQVLNWAGLLPEESDEPDAQSTPKEDSSDAKLEPPPESRNP